ncbi:MAG TPA: hypothetical protein VG757_01970 [Devosia sp.]|nr:hypothetical protein [Devosia sp.]
MPEINLSPAKPATAGETIAILPALVDTTEAARLIGMSSTWLEHDRMEQKPKVPFVRIGVRAVRYRLTDLHAYVEHRLVPAAA